MRADSPAAAPVLLLASVLLPGTAPAAHVTPTLKVLAGWNDNANVRSDEGSVREKPQADGLWLLRPGVRYDSRPSSYLDLTLKHQTGWEQYPSVTTGNSFAHIGDVSVRTRLSIPAVRASVGYRVKDYKNLRDAAGKQHLDSRAGRAAASLDLPVGRTERYSLTAGYVVVFRTYPGAEVTALPAATCCPREEIRHTGSVGLSANLAQWMVCSVQYQKGDNNGNALQFQHGKLRDYYSYQRHGATLAIAGSRGTTMLWNAALHYQLCSFDERTVPERPRRETATSTAWSAGVSWLYSENTAFIVEHTYFRHVSDNELFSFDNHRLAAGLKLSSRLDL